MPNLLELHIMLFLKAYGMSCVWHMIQQWYFIKMKIKMYYNPYLISKSAIWDICIGHMEQSTIILYLNYFSLFLRKIKWFLLLLVKYYYTNCLKCIGRLKLMIQLERLTNSRRSYILLVRNHVWNQVNLFWSRIFIRIIRMLTLKLILIKTFS